ncbi:TRAP transporter small permease [Devosia sp.]|uniref:TRAP transporter small permease subunit n=1 Tax=Devosia sp. TaxID=1871048 RepID=UPI002B0002D3|nr:TRAP transporter small permease [Devosia sp.]
MCLIFANALLRKLFNAPIPASLEITQALLVAVIMLPFAYTQWRREHVNTVFFTAHLSRAARRNLQFVFLVLGFLLFAAVTYGTFHYALRSYGINEMAWGATIQFPVWPAKMMVSLGTLMLSIQFLLDAIHTVLFDSVDDLDQIPEMAANV